MQRTYQHVRKLGRGAFGEVVIARVVETGELVALKRVYVRSPDQGVPDNLVREIRCLQAISHPNVVPLLDVQIEGSTLVLVQPYCVLDLSGLLKAQMHLIPERLVKGIMQQMLRGLAACHAAGVMHRDLKPSNVLLTAEGVVKLCDFGLARPMAPAPPDPGARGPQYTHTVATRWYRAPELLYGARQYGPAVDIWALGVVLAELLGLSPLIPGENDIDQLGRTIGLLGGMEKQWPEVVQLPDYGKIMFPDCEPTPLAEVLPAASPSALDMLALMIRCNPEERPSAEQLLSHSFLMSEPLPSPPYEIAALMESSVMRAREVDRDVNQVLARAKRKPDVFKF